MSDGHQQSNTNSTARIGKKDLILAEAIRLFNQQGYFDTRLEDIAEAFGTGKTSISYHFKNKQLLLSTAYDRACAFYEAEITKARHAKTGKEQIISFSLACVIAAQRADHGKDLPIAMMSDFDGLSAQDAESIQSRYKDLMRQVREMLALGINDGSINLQSIGASTFFIFNLVHWVPKWLRFIPGFAHNNATSYIEDLLTHGLRGEANLVGQISRRSELPNTPAIFDREIRNRMKRDAILRTGIRHLNRNGYRNLSLDDICAELGVTRGALYYQIPDKESFLVASFERTCELVEDALDRHISGIDTPTLLSIQSTVSNLFKSHIVEHEPLLRLNLLPLLDGGPRRVVESRINRILARFSELIGRGQMDGSIRDFECPGCEHLIFGTMFAASSRRYVQARLDASSEDSDGVYSPEAYFEILFYGLNNKQFNK